MTDSSLTIHHDADRCRFATTVEELSAYLDYRLDDDVLTITHTLVPKEIGGRGIAGELVRTAFEHAHASGQRVVPQCSYAAAWLQTHPEHADSRS